MLLSPYYHIYIDAFALMCGKGAKYGSHSTIYTHLVDCCCRQSAWAIVAWCVRLVCGNTRTTGCAFTGSKYTFSARERKKATHQLC